MNFRGDRVAPDKPVTPARLPLAHPREYVRAGDDNGREKVIS